MSKLKLHLDVGKIDYPELKAKNELVFALPFLNEKQLLEIGHLKHCGFEVLHINAPISIIA